VKEVRIYVEGGGDREETRAAIRRGMGEFLEPLRRLARRRRIGWKIVACGSRNAAFGAFRNALKMHPGAWCVLLVDSEAPVTTSPWDHLRRRDGWDPPGVGDECCHLMVQVMEAWLVADIETLASFYGSGFRRTAIPKTSDVEQIDKAKLEQALIRATRDSSRGRYHKIRHGGRLLAVIDPTQVRQRAPHCDRLFVALTNKIH